MFVSSTSGVTTFRKRYRFNQLIRWEVMTDKSKCCLTIRLGCRSGRNFIRIQVELPAWTPFSMLILEHVYDFIGRNFSCLKDDNPANLYLAQLYFNCNLSCHKLQSYILQLDVLFLNKLASFYIYIKIKLAFICKSFLAYDWTMQIKFMSHVCMRIRQFTYL